MKLILIIMAIISVLFNLDKVFTASILYLRTNDIKEIAMKKGIDLTAQFLANDIKFSSTQNSDLHHVFIPMLMNLTEYSQYKEKKNELNRY